MSVLDDSPHVVLCTLLSFFSLSVSQRALADPQACSRSVQDAVQHDLETYSLASKEERGIEGREGGIVSLSCAMNFASCTDDMSV